jgi:hypothetical protein
MTDQEEVNEWIAKAETDYKAAIDLARRQGESSRIDEEGRWVKRVQALAR